MNSACPIANICPFYNDKMIIDYGLSMIYKKKYCSGDNTICARYRVETKKGVKEVPQDLFPNQYDRADQLTRGRYS